MNPTVKQEKELICVHLRRMLRRDVPEVLQIEQESFQYPWTEQDFLRYLLGGITAEYNEVIVGFMVYEYRWFKFHILNLAVHPSFRHGGIAQQMVHKLMSKLSICSRDRIALEVRETNLTGQLFFRSQGFRWINTLKNCYQDSGEDAYLMEYRLTETAERPMDFQGQIPPD